jgi:hypothetical protein
MTARPQVNTNSEMDLIAGLDMATALIEVGTEWQEQRPGACIATIKC